MKNKIGIILTAFVLAPTAAAYIGPGLGANGLASVIGGAMGLGMFLVGCIWYPIRMAIGKIRKSLRLF